MYKGTYNGNEVAVKRLKFNDEQLRESRLLKAFDEFRNEVFLMRCCLTFCSSLWLVGNLDSVWWRRRRNNSGLRHPNIITMAGFCTKPCYCIITEFVGGGRLVYYACPAMSSISPDPSSVSWSFFRMTRAACPGHCVCGSLRISLREWPFYIDVRLRSFIETSSRPTFSYVRLFSHSKGGKYGVLRSSMVSPWVTNAHDRSWCLLTTTRLFLPRSPISVSRR